MSKEINPPMTETLSTGANVAVNSTMAAPPKPSRSKTINATHADSSSSARKAFIYIM
jgi:hypothetical protein